MTWRTLSIRALLFSALLLTSLWCVGRFYDRSFARGDFYKAQWVNSFVDRYYDIAILGSSRSYVTIDAKGLADQKGLSVINLSLDGGGAADMACLTRMFLDDNGNRIKKLLFQVDHWILGGSGSVESSYRFFLPFRNRESVANTLKAAYPERGNPYRIRNRVPFLSYARCNAYWSFDKLVNCHVPVQSPVFDRHGSYLINREFPPDAPSKSVVKEEFVAQFQMIDEVTRLCAEHDVEVYCFTAPWLMRVDHGGWERASRKLKKRFRNYRDFGDAFIGQKELFYDMSHVNQKGAKKLTALLLEWLNESQSGSPTGHHDN